MSAQAPPASGLPPRVDRVRFPVDPWRLVETSSRTDDLGTTETLFAVGNGYLGVRGTLPEGRPSHTHGTYVNGFHETWPIRHPEEAFGFAELGQTIVNVPDTTVMRLYVDDEPLLLSVADLVDYERALDFATGMLTSQLVWRTPSGNRVRVRSTRMVSMTSRHLAVLTLEVTLLDHAAPVVVSSQVLNRQDGADEYSSAPGAGPAREDPRRAPVLQDRVLQPQLHADEAGRIVLGYRCAHSRMTLAVAVDHHVETADVQDVRTDVGPDGAKQVIQVRAQPHRPITVTKVVALHTSRGVPARELADRCRRTLDRVRDDGVAAHVADQGAWFDGYWSRSDVRVEGDPEMQQAIRWNLFQLAQAAARADGNGIPAKGVTGSGYEGHYFWDTEVYVLPYFMYTTPLVARNALRFRHTMLPAARRRARQLTQDGALFPWRTINGAEASAYYAAGTAQYHIDADVAYAVSRYVAVTGDDEFLDREGLEILVETARMWADLGFWRGNGGPESFHIHGVTGPDEYTTVVNDNLFTNVMARSNLRRAAQAVRDVRARRPQEFARICARLGLSTDEAVEWERVAAAMAVPFDDHLGIHPQDSQFHEREVWDLASTPPEKRPLFLHYHPLVIYRFQVLKQADVVLALFLQGADFTAAEKRADFEYYDGITTGDSTLSAVVQSIIAAEVGYHELALRYFHRALYVDLADLHGNASDGVHVASAGGVWSALVHGFGGMRDHDGAVSFDPRLPRSWEALTFCLTVRGSRIRVRVSRDAIELVLESGPPLPVEVRGQAVQVEREPVAVPLEHQGPLLDGAPDSPALQRTRRPDGTVITASVPHESGRNA